MLKKLKKDTHWSWKSWRTQDASTDEKCLGSQLVTRHLGASATHWRSSLSCVTVHTHIGLRDFWDAKLTNPAGSGYTIATGVKRFTCRLKRFVLPVWSSQHSMSERRPLPSGCKKKKSVSWHSSRQENSWIRQDRKLPPVWKVTATSPIKPKTWLITPGNATAIYEPLAYTKKHIRGAAW